MIVVTAVIAACYHQEEKKKILHKAVPFTDVNSHWLSGFTIEMKKKED